MHLYSGRGFLGAGGDVRLIQMNYKQQAMCACLHPHPTPAFSWAGEHGQGSPAQTQSQLWEPQVQTSALFGCLIFRK